MGRSSRYHLKASEWKKSRASDENLASLAARKMMVSMMRHSASAGKRILSEIAPRLVSSSLDVLGNIAVVIFRGQEHIPSFLFNIRAFLWGVPVRGKSKKSSHQCPKQEKAGQDEAQQHAKLYDMKRIAPWIMMTKG